MDRKEALIRCSIDHWARLAENEPLENEGPLAQHCPLCDEYQGFWECTGCPIAEKTGHNSCNETPYQQAFVAWKLRDDIPETCEDSCYEELKFLLKLLPKGHQ